MSTILIMLSCLVAIILAGHATFAVLYARKLRTPRPLLADKQCPRATVILCLRGRDPSLERCLAGLLSQDYPHYEVMIVVDQRADPAWDVAARAIERNPQAHVSLQPLVTRRRTCSLKCSALVQAVSEFEETSEADVYALLDQDVIPDTTWLRELVAPLVASDVAASCGYRWFMPKRRTLASIIRAQWNAGAVSLMVMNRICWGGSLAMRADFIRQAQLLDKWSRAICEDTMIGLAAREQDLQVAYLPSLSMVNQDSCSMASLFPWIRRQTLFGFLYNPSFKVLDLFATAAAVGLLPGQVGPRGDRVERVPELQVPPVEICLRLSRSVIACISDGCDRHRVMAVIYHVTLVAASAFTCVAAAQGNSWALLLGSLLAGYGALLVGAHLRIDACAAEKRRRCGESIRGPDATWAILLLFCLPASQLISLAAMVSTLRTTRIAWRGVRYRIGGPLRIQKLAKDLVLEQPVLADEQPVLADEPVLANEQLDLTHYS